MANEKKNASGYGLTDMANGNVIDPVSGTTIDINRTYDPPATIREKGVLIDLNERVDPYDIPTLGHHTVNIEDWENVAAVTIRDRDDPENTDKERHYDAHIRLDLRDTENGSLYKKRVYQAGVNGMQKNLYRQSRGVLGGQRIVDMLNYYKKHPLDIWVKWSDEYDTAVIYFYDVEEWEARRKNGGRLGIDE